MTFLSIINFYQISIANFFKEKFSFFLKIFLLKTDEKILFVTKTSLVIFEKIYLNIFYHYGETVEQFYQNSFGRTSIAWYTNISL